MADKHSFLSSGTKVTVLLFVNVHRLRLNTLTTPRDKAKLSHFLTYLRSVHVCVRVRVCVVCSHVPPHT